MTIRDDFIDAMSFIDDDLIALHIQKKHPTRMQKTARYLMAVGIYAAAILVVAVILPYVIGKVEEPKPPSVDEPAAVETVVASKAAESTAIEIMTDPDTAYDTSEIPQTTPEPVEITLPPETATTLPGPSATTPPSADPTPPETIPSVSVHLPPETTATTSVPVVQAPETTPHASSKQPSVPDVPVVQPETQVSENETSESVTTVLDSFSVDEDFNEFRESLIAYGETVDNGLRLLVGVNRVVEYGDDSFIIEVVLGNESSQVMRLYDPEGERYPPECLEISFGNERVDVGRSMDLDSICMLPPGKVIIFSRHISIQAFEQLTNVDWNAEWFIIADMSYLIAGEEYHSGCGMEIPHESKK